MRAGASLVLALSLFFVGSGAVQPKAKRTNVGESAGSSISGVLPGASGWTHPSCGGKRVQAQYSLTGYKCKPPPECKQAPNKCEKLPGKCKVAEVKFSVRSHTTNKMTKADWHKPGCAKAITAEARKWYKQAADKVVDRVKELCKLSCREEEIDKASSRQSSTSRKLLRRGLPYAMKFFRHKFTTTVRKHRSGARRRARVTRTPSNAARRRNVSKSSCRSTMSCSNKPWKLMGTKCTRATDMGEADMAQVGYDAGINIPAQIQYWGCGSGAEKAGTETKIKRKCAGKPGCVEPKFEMEGCKPSSKVEDFKTLISMSVRRNQVAAEKEDDSAAAMSCT